MNDIFAVFVFLELTVGVCTTLWFVLKKIIFPAIDFIVDYLSSYDEFKKWRERNGDTNNAGNEEK